MRRSAAVLLLAATGIALSAGHVFAAGTVSRTTPSRPVAGTYAPRVQGAVVAHRLAGVEPDGDPLDQVLLKTRLGASGGVPAANLLVDAYLENFKPDTTPILPDLLPPYKTAQNLGGFLQGKALLTDDAGNVLYIGSFVAEAFLNNANHAAMTLYGTNAAYGGKVQLKGSFLLHADGSLAGSFGGRITLPSAGYSQLVARRGAVMKDIRQIISVVSVHPAPMVGRATSGSSSTPLHTGFGSNLPPGGPSGTTSRHINPWSVVAGVGAIMSLLLAAGLYVIEHRKKATPLPP